jgi:hypothetical protein
MVDKCENYRGMRELKYSLKQYFGRTTRILERKIMCKCFFLKLIVDRRMEYNTESYNLYYL